MELTFLGTSAGVPTIPRNVSALVVSPEAESGEYWLFDCGEATQHQMLKSRFHPGKISRIFITHLHGDHIFGLPGLLCSRSMSGIVAPLTVYGPPGIREFIEVTLRLSGSWTGYPLEIVEIEAGIVCQLPMFTISAVELNHPVTCFGYRIEQSPRPGALDADALRAAGVPPGPLYQTLKRGEVITLEDGRIIDGRDYLSPSQPGKIVAIFGDTAPTPEALILARDADLMVHEATLDRSMTERANSRGHCTSSQTASLARDAGVKRLIITHLSSRYDSTGSEHLLAECREIFPATELAHDFSVFRC
ncbi:ribonuclease BN [Salmonella enterica subsp. enterica serovar Choleraesuis]|nr:ribonuclease BN [Salmonella enterica subsp. enterica serovar Choleraesuis]